MKFLPNSGRILRPFIAAGIAGILLSGCSTFGNKQKVKLAYVERPAETLYNNALKHGY